MNGKRRKENPQGELFRPPAQPRRHGRAEDDRVYLAVLYLRTNGLRVYRAGLQTHIVNGRRMTTAQLLALGIPSSRTDPDRRRASPRDHPLQP